MFASLLRRAAKSSESSGRGTGARPGEHAGLRQRLRGDRSGNVAMMFALLVIPLVAAIGLAIDMGRIYHVNMHTQGALDAAALAAGRVAQVEKTNTVSKASAAASAYFDQAKPTDVVTTSIVFAPNSQQTEFTVTATSWVKTPFLSVLNLINYRGSEGDAPGSCKGNYYACTKVVSKATAQICLNCSDTGGGNSDEGTNLEISMMLDITGSMSGDKIADLIAAAKDLVDIVVWDDQSQYTSRVALAPFAPAVNVGTNYFTLITGKADEADPDGDGYNYPASCYKKSGKLKDSCEGDSEYKVKTYAKCVVERTGTEAATDKAPTGAGTWLPTWNDATGSTSTSCTPTAKIIPLTKDRTTLKSTIDGFKASGSTAGQLGTAFAWYLLSPNWNNVWPAGNQPTAYGTAKVKKIAILMTDGIYNTLQGKSYGDYSVQATQAATQAIALCSGMKAKGITVYSVLFEMDGVPGADTALKACASTTDKFYNAANGDQLKAAFRDIALKISKLRLTN